MELCYLQKFENVLPLFSLSSTNFFFNSIIIDSIYPSVHLSIKGGKEREEINKSMQYRFLANFCCVILNVFSVENI